MSRDFCALPAGTTSRAEINRTYKILRRIEGEERALDSAVMVLTSTREEVDKQWSLYNGYNSNLEASLRYNMRISRAMPRMVVIPPGELPGLQSGKSSELLPAAVVPSLLAPGASAGNECKEPLPDQQLSENVAGAQG